MLPYPEAVRRPPKMRSGGITRCTVVLPRFVLLIGWLYQRQKRRKDPKARFEEMVNQHSMFNTQTNWDSTTLEVENRAKKPKPKAASSEGPRTLRAEV